MAKQSIIIDDRPLETLTEEELNEVWKRKYGVPYTPSTKEEFEKGLQEAISFGLLTETEAEKARSNFNR